MSFKSQFSASRDKAHNHTIATKIHDQMSKLRAGVDVHLVEVPGGVLELPVVIVGGVLEYMLLQIANLIFERLCHRRPQSTIACVTAV